MTNNKTLLIIGNGFDLHLGLKSKFTDFFNNNALDVDNIFFNVIFSSDTGFINHEDNKVFLIYNPFIDLDKLRTDEFIDNGFLDSLINGIISDEGKSNDSYYVNYKINNKFNFWSLYFKLLEKASNESIIDKQDFDDWNDIEHQIHSLLINSSKFLEFYYNSYLDVLKSDDDKNAYDRYVSGVHKYIYDEYRRISDEGIVRLTIIYLMLYSGWKPYKQNVYNFLFQELQGFENQFLTYLSEVAKYLPNYKSLAQKFSIELADSESYKLINFNYTYFYDPDDPDRYNIHSTLSNHPIFGIGDNDISGEVLSNKSYYMFTKTYRIMTLANSNVTNDTLSPDVNKIVFYGHSLSDADYAYFQSVFDYYDIYNSNVSILFKYSIINDNPDEDVKGNINSIYKLINRYGTDRNHDNLLNKLIIGNRLKLGKV